MQITDVRVYPLVSVRRRYPTVISTQIRAGGITPVEESYFILFEVAAEGPRGPLRGAGEVSDIEPDSLPDLPQLHAELRAALLGRSPYDVGPILDSVQGSGFRVQEDSHPHSHTPTLPYTYLSTRLYQCAVDMALFDLQGKAAGEPVYRLLGGARRAEIDISAVVYIRDASLVAEEVRERRAQGFRDFKLKVGLGIDQDEASLAALREAAGPDAKIKIDPNGAWTVEEAVRCLRRLERYDVAGVETPIPARDVEGKVALKRETRIPILEHVGDPKFALECARAGAVDVFNVALCGCGGIYRALQVAAVAQAAGIPLLLGSTLELWPGTAAQAHFGAAVGCLGFPSDLVGPLMYQSDVVRNPWSYRDGLLPVADRPGLGVELDYETLGEPL